MADINENKEQKPLSTEPYRGVRDFYPEDMAVQNYIFGKMRTVAERFGYVEYNASILEPSELYEAKSGEELAGQQAYRFKDRSDREVTLRPEMTPTLARMVARRKNELMLPLRFFSIPNLFRYERPQRGRTREHWQLNVDIFGVHGIDAEVEMISLAHSLMSEFGAQEKDFTIHVNSRALIHAVHEELGLNDERANELLRLIDRKEKMEAEEFNSALAELAPEHHEMIRAYLEADTFDAYVSLIPEAVREHAAIQRLQDLFTAFQELGIENVRFDPTLVRGIDYYTDTVFEVFDTNPENTRALFGGGRYDNLLELFDVENVPAVGFGAGDVALRNFLETHNLLPRAANPTLLFIATTDPEYIREAQQLAGDLRRSGIPVAVNLTDKKVGDQFAIADKKGIPYALCVGESEKHSREFTVKHMQSGEEKTLSESEIAAFLKEQQ